MSTTDQATKDQAVRDEVAFARRGLTFHKHQSTYGDSAQAVKDAEARRKVQIDLDAIAEMQTRNKEVWGQR